MDPTYYSSGDGAWHSLCDVIDDSSIFDSGYRGLYSGCMENTRVALLDSIYQDLDQHERTDIWLNGLAGVGKTSIAFTVAEKMKAAKRLAATFFFSHKHPQGAAAVIPTIAYQLALVFPRIRDDIERAIETDRMLLSPTKSRRDQMRELIINPLGMLRFSQETPYAIIIDALDECFEAASLITLLIDALSGPDLPIIHLIFTSRPETQICAAMPKSAKEISLTTGDEDIIQDVSFYLRVSLTKIRTSRPKIFGQPPRPWPSDDQFAAFAVKAGGLFVYAAIATNFISAVDHHPEDRLDLLLREESTVSEDIDQLYRKIIASSGNPYLHCRMLASIIRLRRPLPLSKLQEFFHADRTSLVMMLESFSPVILNPPDGVGRVQIYHSSLRDFMKDPLRSKEYHVDDAHIDAHLACYCIDLLIRQEPRAYDPYQYACISWGDHLSMAYPSRKLRHLLALFAGGKLQHLVESARKHDMFYPLITCLHQARDTCFSLKWIRSPSDIVIAWRIVKASRKVQKAWEFHCRMLDLAHHACTRFQ
ncbi:hypothetical protein K503DRAFT_628866 [Rhizopogon vinicolor AM-OR11-026]|uniref:Nephrocystin 3-like N-terminal domain-containing protein n=1 Tax=Rhizopogon vinicolor AM-OR11-026 TaxID=1314800 RepID=A0A1B7N641_9AGAM|nr:hypothetical protein K503DRAFT_628866 [Rhizopogon vinicolor AM-OR11-026]